MAAFSTVLFEAMLLGKVPITIKSCCFDGALHYEHEVLDMTADYRATLHRLFSAETRAKYARKAQAPEIDWLELLRGNFPQAAPGKA
jgi:hypothetical protein